MTGRHNYFSKRVRYLLALAMAMLLFGPSPAFADLSVGQIQLYFMDGGKRSETVAAVGEMGVKVYADFQVEGSGQMEGFWEVDGRRLENVSRRINFKQKLTLTTSAVPGIPAFEPGLHRVRLVITSPGLAFTPPTVTYFVSGSVPELAVVSQIKPRKGATIKGKTTFKWHKLADARIYIVTFYETEDEPPVMTAMVEKVVYKLAMKIVTDFFEPGRSYLWKVTGVDEKGNILGESPTRTFQIKGE